MKIYSPAGVIQDVDGFVSSLEQIWRNLALHHLLTHDPLQWMGAVRMRVQTADKYITINPSKSTQLKSISKCLGKLKVIEGSEDPQMQTVHVLLQESNHTFVLCFTFFLLYSFIHSFILHLFIYIYL